jgi:hypothetical protein
MGCGENFGGMVMIKILKRKKIDWKREGENGGII